MPSVCSMCSMCSVCSVCRCLLKHAARSMQRVQLYTKACTARTMRARVYSMWTEPRSWSTSCAVVWFGGGGLVWSGMGWVAGGGEGDRSLQWRLLEGLMGRLVRSLLPLL